MFVPTGYYTLTRNINEDCCECEENTQTVNARMVGSVLEQYSRVEESQTGRSMPTVYTATGRFRANEDVRQGDALLDNKRGVWYTIESVRQNNSGVHTPDIIAVLTRT